VSKYELSDALVANVVGAAESGLVESHLIAALISDLKPQIPLPVPTKVGAVVKTEHPTLGGYYLRWAHDNATHSPWVQVGNHEEPYRTDEIGRITEVLAKGVDL
jgi:hypothetical protein